MVKPCPLDPNVCACHICKLFLHDERYRKLWDGQGPALPAQPAPIIPGKTFASNADLAKERAKRGRAKCQHLGDKLELKTTCPVGCGGGTELHACGIHGTCRRYGNDETVMTCWRCPEYQAEEQLTVDQWTELLTSIKLTNDGGLYTGNQTKAVHRIIDELRQSLIGSQQDFAVERGIVTSGGGRYWPGTWTMAAICREMGWKHPIQAWYLGEPEHDEFWISELRKLDVVCVDAHKVRKLNPYRILNGFEIKLYAVLHSGIEQPLWLDSDCYPARDPNLLYECSLYQQTGSVHYPDLANAEPWTRWERWGVERDDSPPIETGQYLYHLGKVWEEAQITSKLNEMSDLTYHWDYGDKGPARVAWAWTKRRRTIYEQVPKWVGPAFIHLGPDAEPLFVHRCRGKVNPSANSFYTPQHGNGMHAHDNLPAEAIYQHYLAKAKALAELREPTTSE
jgi:hypothetical protein